MKLKTVFTVNYIYAFLFGAGFMFFPAFCSSLVGFDVTGDGSLIARCLGIFVFSTGVLTLCARNTEESNARRAILSSLFVLYVLLVVFKVLLNTLWDFPLGLMFLVLYVFHLVLVLSYGYYLFGKPPAVKSHAA